MQENKRYTFQTDHAHVSEGLSQLWALPSEHQQEVLSVAMERFDRLSAVSLLGLGYAIQAEHLVHRTDRYYAGRMSDGDILSAALVGNLDVFPIHALHSDFLKNDGLDCGIWDGEFGQPGYYWPQRVDAIIPAINPADSRSPREMWSGPRSIPRVAELRRNAEFRHLNLEGMEDDDGCIIMSPNLAYLCGYWPAVSIQGLNITLETRSNWGRFALAGAVNSTRVHDPFHGVLTAEGTTFAKEPLVVSTAFPEFQMSFEYVNPSLGRESKLTFSSDQTLSLAEAARQYQFNPEQMLPRVPKRKRKNYE